MTPPTLPKNIDPPPAPKVTFEQKQEKLATLMAAGKSAEAIELIAEMLESQEAVGESPLARETAATLSYRQAEIRFGGPDKAKARPALEKALGTEGAFQPSARILLARILLESGEETDFRAAVELLERNLDSKEMQKDRTAHERTLWRLGYLWYQKKNWERAAIRFRQAIQFYPDSTEARQGGYHLGMSYWFQAGTLGRSIAESEEKLKQPRLAEREKAESSRKLEEMYGEYTGFLKRAREPFSSLEVLLLKQSELTAGELSLLQQTSFKAAACSFGLGEFDDCIKRYEDLAKRYEGQIDELVARSQIWQCYAIYLKNKPQEAAFALAKIREAFPRIPDREFDGTTPERRRAYWEDWLKNVQDISLRD